MFRDSLRRGFRARVFGGTLMGLLLMPVAARGQDPWADRVAAYGPGTTPAPGYLDPQTALGAPERFTGEGAFPSVVSIFNPAFGTDELVSIGEGGYLTVEFNEPITNDPGHKFGVDFIIFGNGGFADDDFPNGRVSTPPFPFGFDAMRVSVSENGVDFVALDGEFTEGFFPAQGYRDAGPYDSAPGHQPTDFTIPVNPNLALSDFAGLTLAQVLALYDGSGGGTPVDVNSVISGLAEVRFVRIDVLDDHNSDTALNVEIEAFAAVPEPATLWLLGGLALCIARSGRGRP